MSPDVGPVLRIPTALLLPDVIVCYGEDDEELHAALDASGLPRGDPHRYRQFVTEQRGDVLCISAPLGSAAVEASLLEILRPPVRRIILVGTAGAMPKCTAPRGVALEISPARTVMQNFDAHEKQTWEASLATDLPTHPGISTDRFYGFSPEAEGPYPAEPAMLEAWHRLRHEDAVVDMEVAAFYHYCQTFGAPDLQYVAVKAIANEVDDLASMPENSASALQKSVAAAVALLGD